MSSNADTSVARRFHDATKYSVVPAENGDDAILMGTPPTVGPAMGDQDLAIEPYPFKVYPSLEPIPLPRDVASTGMTALQALAESGARDGGARPDLATIARLMLRSNGVLKQWTSPAGREFTFRAAGCTGARYHLEFYLATADLPGLAAGVYHYSAEDHTLRRLRAGDYRAALVDATGHAPKVAAAPVIAIATSTFWRNAWRYQERAYRHVYWDTGTLLTSLLPVAADAGMPATVIAGFADGAVNALLGVDGEREAAIALVALGHADDAPPAALEITPLDLPTKQISAREIDFPLIREMHAASSLDVNEVADWRAEPIVRNRPEPAGALIPLPEVESSALPVDSIDAVIQRRRSNRHYDTSTPLSMAQLATVLDRASTRTSLDALDPDSDSLFDAYLIVNNVEGWPKAAICITQIDGRWSS